MVCCKLDAATHTGVSGSATHVAVPKSIESPEVCFGTVRKPQIIVEVLSNLIFHSLSYAM